MKLAKEVFEETYTGAYVAHAPIETHTSLATIENGKVTVWASTSLHLLSREQLPRG